MESAFLKLLGLLTNKFVFLQMNSCSVRIKLAVESLCRTVHQTLNIWVIQIPTVFIWYWEKQEGKKSMKKKGKARKRNDIKGKIK